MIKALQFHRITPDLQAGGTWNTPRQFAAFLETSLSQGIRFVLPDESRDGIVLTFDDGNQSVFDHAFPLLQEFNVPAIVFLVAGYIGKKSRWDLSLTGRPGRHLGWPEILAMYRSGIRFGAHGLTHCNLTRLDDDELKLELGSAKQILEERLGPVDSISYPFNRCDLRVMAGVKQAGYRYGFGGDGSHALAIKKEAIYITDTVTTLRVKIQERPRLWYRYERIKQTIINGFTIATMLKQERRKKQ